MGARFWMGIAWPAFLMAAVLEMLVFAMVDPSDLHGLNGGAIEAPRQAVYTVAFFVFWAVTALTGVLSVWLTRVPQPSAPAAGEGAEALNRRTAD